jgi:hypothetical protein
MSLRTDFGADWQSIKRRFNENNYEHNQLSIMGIYDTQELLNAAKNKLIGQGFKNENLETRVSESYKERFESEKAGGTIQRSRSSASSGAATGAVMGGTLGWLVGMGVFTFSGMGALLALGPLLSALLGITAGAIMGGISGAIIGAGIQRISANKFVQPHTGGILLSIRCQDSDWINRANKLLEVTGARDIASRYEA